MGADVRVPFKFSPMAINGEAQPYRGGGRLPTSLDYAISFLGKRQATDLCVGWALGQFHALDCKQPRSCHMATTTLPCHVEYLERIQFATVTEHCNIIQRPSPSTKVLGTPHSTSGSHCPVNWIDMDTNSWHGSACTKSSSTSPIESTQTKHHQEHQLYSGSYPDIPIPCSASEIYGAHKAPCSTDT